MLLTTFPVPACRCDTYRPEEKTAERVDFAIDLFLDFTILFSLFLIDVPREGNMNNQIDDAQGSSGISENGSFDLVFAVLYRLYNIMIVSIISLFKEVYH
jgi:hypothetical protein